MAKLGRKDNGSLNSVSSQCVRGKLSVVRNQTFLSGKKKSKKCNPPDFKFYPSKLTDKDFPIRCNVKFSLLFLYCLMQRKHKINITPYGDFLYYLTCQDKT